MTLKELIEGGASKMSHPGAPTLSEEKLEGVRAALKRIAVPDVQNKETFAKSYNAILGELYKAFQLEHAAQQSRRRGSRRSHVLNQLANALAAASFRQSQSEPSSPRSPRRLSLGRANTAVEEQKPRKQSVLNSFHASRLSLNCRISRRSSNPTVSRDELGSLSSMSEPIRRKSSMKPAGSQSSMKIPVWAAPGV